ncbi:MAG: hypothetical protein Q4Q58_07435 [Thermoplasmata archaeon]|nr:hypothetical protein [Thermoplasmata archaeon]
MTYKIVQPRGNGKFYLYEGRSEWDPEKRMSVQKRVYLGACDEDGNLLKDVKHQKVVTVSPVYGPYRLLTGLCEKNGLRKTLVNVYGKEDGLRILALAILGVVEPDSVRQTADIVDDTYIRELLDIDCGFSQSAVCRFLQKVGRDTGHAAKLMDALAPKSGAVIFDIVCLGTDSELLDYAEVGRKMRITGSKQVNLGLVHSMEDGLPFMYRVYPGSVSDVVTLRNLTSDLDSMGVKPIEMVMDRGFFSHSNVVHMMGLDSGFTMPVPAKNAIFKLLVSESVEHILSPLNTEILNDSVVRAYETRVLVGSDGFEKTADSGERTLRALVIQDDETRTDETATLYRRLKELEKLAASTPWEEFEENDLPRTYEKYASLLEYSEGPDGMTATKRRRNAISLRENSCGRFVFLTTSDEAWIVIFARYRQRNDVEYDFSELKSDLEPAVKGKSDHDSMEGGLLINLLSLRIRTDLLNRMRDAGMTDRMCAKDVLRTLGKLKISQIGGKWRLNEVTKAQRDIFEKLGVEIEGRIKG